MKIIDKYNMLSPNIGHRIYDSEDIIRFIYLFRQSQLRGLVHGGPATIHLCVLDDSHLYKDRLFNQYGYPDDMPSVIELFITLTGHMS